MAGGGVGVASLRRYPGFLLFWAGLSSFLIVGRKLCLLSRRIPLVVLLVRKVDELGSRIALFRPHEP